MKRHLISAVITLSLMLATVPVTTSCGGASRHDGGVPSDTLAAEPTLPPLPMPPVPSTLTTPTARAAYLLAHFWDAMDWNDSTLLASESFMEQHFADYFVVLALADSTTASYGVTTMLKQASVNQKATDCIADISSRYLYNHDSPMYQPVSYAVMVDAMLRLKQGLSDATRLRLEQDRRSLLANRPGTQATDFEFVTRSETSTRLSRHYGKPTILMFYDSDCEICAKIEGWLAGSENINRAIAEGRLQVIAIDIFTPERATWLEHARTLPSTWTVGYAPTVDDEELYHVRATPSLYYLDPQGVITVRDADDATIRSWAGLD